MIDNLDLQVMLQRNPDLGLLNNDLVVAKGEKPRKYRNNPTEYKGRVYHSAKEARYAQELDMRLKGGGIVAWFPQVRFALGAEIWYVADFVVIDYKWDVEVVDCKGFITKEYKLKRKLFKARYGEDIIEV